MRQIVFISEKNRERYLKIINPIAKFLAGMGIHPNILSTFGLILSMATGLMFGMGAFFWAAWVLVLAGVFDTLDGHIARQMNKATPFGAFFDSTLDRYSDMALFLGLAYFFAEGNGPGQSMDAGNGVDPSPLTVVVIILAMVGSFMVSYARARAEGLGLDCKGGLMQRPERITLLIMGSLLAAIPAIGPLLLKGVLIILAVSTNVTAIHRIVYVKKQFQKENKGP